MIPSVFSAAEFEKSDLSKFTHLIRIYDPGFLPEDNRPALILKFSDVDHDMHWSPPMPEHIARARDYVLDCPDLSKVAIHCAQGRSRSVALAIILATDRGMDPTTAHDAIRAYRATNPNPRMLALADIILP